MRLQKKSYSRLSLADLLRRRRSSLKKFLSETGIVTYELLKTRCESMGVIPPCEQDFSDARGNPVVHDVSSPTEGIVVLEPLPAPTSLDQQEYSTEDETVTTQDNSSNKTTKKKRSKKSQEDVFE